MQKRLRLLVDADKMVGPGVVGTDARFHTRIVDGMLQDPAARER